MDIRWLKQQLKDIRKEKKQLESWDYANKMKGSAIIHFLEKHINLLKEEK